jgi:ABC-2 type transport system ATP-binding protein
MSGVSYGGGIQLVTSAIDKRIDAITPTIAWHSLVTALYKNQTPKGGWGSVLFGAGLQGTTLGGVYGGSDPNGPQPPKSSNPHIQSAFTNGLATGTFPQDDVDWFASRGPGDEGIGKIRIPTLLVEGTADTLFTLPESIRNYEILHRNGVPVKMLWFCGGHGVCLTNKGEPLTIEKSVIAWLSRYLKGNTAIDTGPGFRWIADDGVLRSGPTYPLPQGAPLTGSGSGTLPLVPGDTSGNQIAAQPAANAVSVPLEKPTGEIDLVGEPTLTLTYSGTGSQASTSVYAQIVDDQKALVVGNQAMPFRVTLDGASHTLNMTLEGVALHAKAGSSYTLQLIGGTNTYFFQRAAGAINFSAVKVSVPSVRAGSATVLRSALGPQRLRLAVSPRRVRVGRRTRFRFHVTSTSASGARVAVRRATVSFAGRRYRTSARGYVTVVRVLRHSGRYNVRATRSGYRAAAAQVRAVPRRRAARFTG